MHNVAASKQGEARLLPKGSVNRRHRLFKAKVLPKGGTSERSSGGTPFT